MEDRTFELLTKMYGEFSEFKFDFKDMKNDIIRIENKLDSNCKALFDGYKQMYERLEIVENKIDILTLRVDKQEV
jgi:hypothetical protein